MCGHNLIHTLITSLTLVSLVSSELYHIVPTDSPSLCVNYTADSCTSLAQFPGRYVTSNDSSLTLVFSPGEHTLSQIIHISNIHNVTLIGDSEQLTVINYVGDSGFELVNISSVLFVAALTMSRNGQTVSVLTIDNVRSVLVKSCHFVGRNDFQTPEISATVYVASAHNISISNSVFENINGNYVLEANEAIGGTALWVHTGGTALWVRTSHNVLVEESLFINNSIRGTSMTNFTQAFGVIILEHTFEAVTIINCNMKNNTVLCHGCQSAAGGAITLFGDNRLTVTVMNSTFEENRIKSPLAFGGAICVFSASMVNVSGSTFLHNSADSEGGSIYIRVLFHSSNNIYFGNTASRGGAINSLAQLMLSNDHYEGNTASEDGGAVLMFYDAVAMGDALFTQSLNKTSHFEIATIVNNTFVNNTAPVGGALHIDKRKLNITKTLFSNNWVHLTEESVLHARYAVIMVSDCTVSGTASIVLDNAQFFAENFKIYKIFGSLVSSNSVLEFDGKCEFIENTFTFYDGGAISAIRSHIEFKSSAVVEISGNRARNGGGIFLFESQLNISCPVNITGNTATQSGGGISAYRSDISFTHDNKTMTIDNNIAQRNGGGAALVSSTLNVYKGIVIFHNNTAHQGGGAVYLEQRSILSVFLISITEINGWVSVSPARMRVQGNSAQYGGGVFVDDYTSGHTLCEHVNNHNSRILECFMQGLGDIVYGNIRPFRILFFDFANNTAQEKGNDIYGGLLDRCTVSPDAFILNWRKNVNGLYYIKQMSFFDKKKGIQYYKHRAGTTHHISSSPSVLL